MDRFACFRNQPSLFHIGYGAPPKPQRYYKNHALILNALDDNFRSSGEISHTLGKTPCRQSVHFHLVVLAKEGKVEERMNNGTKEWRRKA